jgi:hypothetical protein
MSDEEASGVCYRPEDKDRLMRSYESEMIFYSRKLDHADDDVDPRLLDEWRQKKQVAEDNLLEVKSIPVCDEGDDVDTPAELPDTSSPSSEAPSRSPPPS